MIGVYSILLGAAIVASALFLLKREFKRAYFIGTGSRKNIETSLNSDDLLGAVNIVEDNVREMSEAFYDIAGDLEGKYSVHEKEISLLQERIESLEGSNKSQKEEINKLKKQLKNDKTEENDNNVLYQEETFELEKRVAEVDRRDNITNIEINQEVKKEEKLYVSTSFKPKENDIKEKIISLRSEGYSLRQIAKELNIGLGEIQLILNMKR